MEELIDLLSKTIYDKLNNTNLTEEEKCKLKTEMQQEIEISIIDTFKRADKFVSGEINKFGILI